MTFKYCTASVLCVFMWVNAVLADTEVSTEFALEINQQYVDQSIHSVFVMPEAFITIRSNSDLIPAIELASSDVSFIQVNEKSWRAKAPRTSGHYTLTIHPEALVKPIVLNVFVLVPTSNMVGGVLEGYRIDDYPIDTYKNLEKYEAPAGFVRVTEANVDMKVSPHFTLRQFLCKQRSGYPKFVVMQDTTLIMLEDLLEEVNKTHLNIDTFGFISGYRTPYYNRSIGNVQYSRHVFGDANDIFIDQDKNGRMDDVNGDGKYDAKDAKWFFDLASKFQDKSDGVYVGGVGKYKPNSRHGGFIHVDNRGYRARW